MGEREEEERKKELGIEGIGGKGKEKITRK